MAAPENGLVKYPAAGIAIRIFYLFLAINYSL